RVAVYMPMIPELAIALLACARVGAPHNVVFGGYSSSAIKDRVEDANCKLIITADGGWRRGKVIKLKDMVDQALADGGCPSVENVVVARRAENEVHWQEGRDIWWDDLVAEQSGQHTPEAFDAEHPLFILYTSGTTG